MWTVRGKSSHWASGKGATENHEICEELLEELERRGLKLSKQVIWVTDGGGGIIKALKGRYGKKLIHQRCTLHKDRNIQRHLPNTLPQAGTPPLRDRLGAEQLQGREEDVGRSSSAGFAASTSRRADSQALEEVLTLHRLKVPALLRKSLHSTNPIESMFSMVRSCERNIKRYRNSKMRQRWLAAVLTALRTPVPTSQGLRIH